MSSGCLLGKMLIINMLSSSPDMSGDEDLDDEFADEDDIDEEDEDEFEGDDE